MGSFDSVERVASNSHHYAQDDTGEGNARVRRRSSLSGLRVSEKTLESFPQ